MLIKKELLEIPILPVPIIPERNPDAYLTAVDIINLQRSGAVMVADIFYGHNDNLKCRFFSDGKIYLVYWPGETWGKGNPAASSWFPVRSISYKEDTKLAEQFLGKKEKDSWRTQGALAVIDAFISDIVQERRNRAEYNKEMLQKAHFAMFPPLPADLEEYCEQNVFENNYVFFDKLTKSRRRYGRCGHCGKKYRLSGEVKQNQWTKCPYCGCDAIYKASWRGNGPEDKAKICITANVHGQLLIRWTNVTRRFTKDHRFSYGFSDYAYNLYIETTRKRTLYAYEFKTIPYYDTKAWKRWPNGSQNFSNTYIYTNNLEEVFGKRYYNVDLKAGLHGKHLKLCFSGLLNALKQYPEAEYLFKLNMPLLAADTSSIVYGKKIHHPCFTEVLGVSKQFLPMYSSMNVNYYEHQVIKSYGAWVSPEDLECFRKLEIDSDVSLVKDILKTMSFGKFARYFVKQREVTKKKTSFLLIQYRDYISMAKSLKIDMSHKTVRYPANICEAHDAVVDEFNRLKFEKEDQLFKEAVTEIYKKMSVTEFSNEQFFVVFPKLRTELLAEGRSLSHCVGNDNYYKETISGRSLIFFVRRKENPEKPFYTMQINIKQWSIVQIYGFKNNNPPKEVRHFAESFLNALKPAERKKNRRKTA